MASNGPMILCDGLVKIYKVQDLEIVALEGLDLIVDRGEFMAIIGPSGSGKSTLMNILGGLDSPSAGRAMVDGQDLLKLSSFALTRYRRRKVGFVWQQPSRNLIPYLSVEENVELPMITAGISYGERKEWTQELLESVGLWDRRHHTLRQLSGGEQQRTAIGVALANKPVLLLADEPTGEVDTNTAHTILETLRYLNEEYNLTIITVTHDPRISDEVDRVVTIRDGRTSSERVRRLRAEEEEVETDDEKVEGEREETAAEEKVSYHEYVVVDYAGRLQIPREFLEELGISDRAEVELAEDGVLIKPVTAVEEESAQASRLAEVAESWGPQDDSKNWRVRLHDAREGIKNIFTGNGEN
ncbi:MAG: ATP-binding cassette domain-containing protein [Anaerolineales bacterium]